MNFWEKLPKAFLALAPMEDVTDSVFRRIVASVGRPDVCFTEFTNVEAIVHNASQPPSYLKPSVRVLRRKRGEFIQGGLDRLYYAESERPIVAQIWGVEPEKFRQAAIIVRELGFDGIDINLGCPVRDVVKIGACSAMIGKNAQVEEIIAATKEAGLPVSVKTRIGFKKIVTEEWAEFLLGQGLAAITAHGRTAAEMSKVPAHWDEIGKFAKIRTCGKMTTKIVGNGDVKSMQDAKSKMQNYGVDGVMIGRAVLENPWIFDKSQATSHEPQERIDLLKKHLELWEETWGGSKNFASFKKYIKIYVRDYEGAAELRARLMEAKSSPELRNLLG